MTTGTASPHPTPAEVIARRRRQRRDLLAQAARFSERLDEALDVRAVVVFGSAARGDFNDVSDIDVLVVAERLPDHPSERLRALGWPTRETRVEPIAWTADDYGLQRRRRNPIAVEAEEAGVWLRGSAQALGSGH